MKWASFRTIACTSARVSGEALGKSHKRSGPINLEVLLAEKLPEEPTQMIVIQTIRGRYLVRTIRQIGGALDSIDDIQ
jgi:hypothetical protein